MDKKMENDGVLMLRSYQRDVWAKIAEKRILLRKLINEILDLKKLEKVLDQTIESKGEKS